MLVNKSAKKLYKTIKINSY